MEPIEPIWHAALPSGHASRTIARMNEFELIEQCFNGWSVEHPNVLQGIGDDCLVWLDPEPLVVSVDTAVIGRHFPHNASPEQVAQRAFLPAVSDLAAMTATPAFFTLALTLPANLGDAWLIAFAKRLRELAQQYQIMLAGGDTTRGEQLTLTLSMHGRCPHPVLRSGAQVGDDVWVTGHIGQAAAALPYVLGEQQDAPAPWLRAYWQPQPPLQFAQALQGCIHSAIDISDGLIGDARHIATRSQVELALQLDRLPLDSWLQQQGEAGRKLALTGGDDYQLLFTASAQARTEIKQLASDHSLLLTHIGEVRQGKAGVRWYDGDRPVELDWQSYTHF